MQSRALAVGLSFLMVPAEAQVSSEWVFELGESACFASVYSVLGNSKLHLSYEEDNIHGVLAVNLASLNDLPIEKVASAKGVLSGGDTIDLGFLMVAARKPLAEDSAELWTYLLILEPFRLVDTRLFHTDMLNIYGAGEYLGSFPLDGAEDAISQLLNCDMQIMLRKLREG